MKMPAGADSARGEQIQYVRAKLLLRSGHLVGAVLGRGWLVDRLGRFREVDPSLGGSWAVGAGSGLGAPAGALRAQDRDQRREDDWASPVEAVADDLFRRRGLREPCLHPAPGQALGTGQVAGELGPLAQGVDRRRTVGGLHVCRAGGGGGRVRGQFFQDQVYP